MKKSIILSLLCLPIIGSTVVYGKYHVTTNNHSIKSLSAINIGTLFPESQRDLGDFAANNEPKANDILQIIYDYVKANSPSNSHVINDLNVGTASGGANKTVEVSANSAEYSGEFDVTYSIKSKTDLNTLGQPIECTFSTSQPTNKQVLQAFVEAHTNISINQIDINTNATKTIVANNAFSYEIIPASFSSTVSGSVKIVVHKPYQTIPISALIPNTYISIFDTATTNASDIKAQVKYWNDYYINDQIASALQLMPISYNRTYEGQTTASLSATYSFITDSIQLTWMYVPPNSYIKRGPGATATTAWVLTPNFTSSTLSLERDTTIDCFVNNNNLTSFTTVTNHPIIRVCDLTHTSVQTGNIGYNSGHPSQTDDGYQACLYPIKDTSPDYLFHNHMNRSMKKVYVMSKESGNTRIAVFWWS